MLKSYQDFLNERLNESFSSDELYDDVFEFLNNELLDDEMTKLSFSDYAAGRHQEDLQEVDFFIKKLNQKFGEQVLKDIAQQLIDAEAENGYNGHSGMSDIILQHYNKDFPLGGYHMADYDTVIKYAYGWHTTKYGKIAIAQAFKTKEDYLKAMVETLNEEVQMHTGPEVIVHKTLICAPAVSDGNDYEKMIHNFVTGEPDKFLPGKVYQAVSKGKNRWDDKVFDVIFEIYVDGKSILKDEDWIDLFDKTYEQNKELFNSFDWKKILGDKFENLPEEKKNLIRSKIGISKYKI
jgi:hypothetical protein